MPLKRKRSVLSQLNMSPMHVIVGLGIFIALFIFVLLSVFQLNQTAYNQDIRSQAARATRFRLYTRVTDVTWPQLKPYARAGDLYWGHIDGIPSNMRAFTFPDLAALTLRFTDNQATAYTSINLDGEYQDFAQAYSEAKQIRIFIDDFNRRHKGEAEFVKIKFVAFYHLNIIDSYPDILNYPDEVVVGKTNWTASTMYSEAKPYVTKIQAAGKKAIVLTSDKKALQGERDKVPNTNEEVLFNFYTITGTSPTSLALDTVSYYYDGDNIPQLLFALRALRSR